MDGKMQAIDSNAPLQHCLTCLCCAFFYMFMPVFLMAFGLMLHRIFDLVSRALPGIPGKLQR